MLNRLARYILRSELSRLNSRIDGLNETNDILRVDFDGFEDIKLRLKIAEMYIDDDSAIDELLAAEKEKESDAFRDSAVASFEAQYRRNALAQMQGASQTAGIGGCTGQAGMNTIFGGLYR